MWLTCSHGIFILIQYKYYFHWVGRVLYAGHMNLLWDDAVCAVIFSCDSVTCLLMLCYSEITRVQFAYGLLVFPRSSPQCRLTGLSRRLPSLPSGLQAVAEVSFHSTDRPCYFLHMDLNTARWSGTSDPRPCVRVFVHKTPFSGVPVPFAVLSGNSCWSFQAPAHGYSFLNAIVQCVSPMLKWFCVFLR